MKIIRAAKKRLINRLCKSLSPFYYTHLFGRQTPLAGKLGNLVSTWEKEQGKGDVPNLLERWESDYRGGKWAYMRHLNEVSRYSAIVGYISFLKPQGAVLDVGCGEGILFERYRPYGYRKYLGVDISEAAITRQRDKHDGKTDFVRAEAEFQVPDEQFDIIVFNEVLYYFHDPLAAVERYTRALKPDGLVIVSTFTASHRAMAILRLLKARYRQVDETLSRQGSLSWVCSVFAPLAGGVSGALRKVWTAVVTCPFVTGLSDHLGEIPVV